MSNRLQLMNRLVASSLNRRQKYPPVGAIAQKPSNLLIQNYIALIVCGSCKQDATSYKLIRETDNAHHKI